MSIYPKLPTAPEDLSEQDKFNANIINSQFEELVNLRAKFNAKHEKYKKVLERLMLLNAGSSALTIGSGVSSIATGATIVGIPISAGLGGVALFCSGCTALTTALIKKYQKKIDKVIELHDIVTAAISVFETSISRSLEDKKIDYKEFQVLGGLYYKALGRLTSTDKTMETETRNQFEKNLLTELQNLRKTLNTSAS